MPPESSTGLITKPAKLKAHGAKLSLKEPYVPKAYQVIDMGSACLNGFGNGPTPGRPTSDPFSKILSSVIKELENFQNQTDTPSLVTHTATSVNSKTIEFAQKLIDLAPKHIGQGLVSIQTTGTDAVFAAVDVAMQYAKLLQKGNLVLVGGGSYHGSGDIAFGRNPLTLMRLSTPLKNQVFYPPYLPFFKKQSGETDQEYVANFKKAMEKIRVKYKNSH